MNELALFAGAGGGILGGKLLGWKTVCAVEINEYCRRVLCARQDDGCLEPFPIWDDVRTFDGIPWRGIVDVVSGGFPCQDISAAGRGAGITGERSGLWSEFARIIGEVRPQYAFVENSPVLTSRGLGVVLGDLAAMGYDARWGVLSAADAIWLGGTPCLDHLRERIWIVATSDAARDEQGREKQWPERERIGARVQEDADRCERKSIGRPVRIGRRQPCEEQDERPGEERAHWWKSEPGVGRVANGVASRVDRLAALGNGQVPAVVALAWRILTTTTDGHLRLKNT